MLIGRTLVLPFLLNEPLSAYSRPPRNQVDGQIYVKKG